MTVEEYISRLGVVYVMRRLAGGRIYKIGCTSNLTHRYNAKRSLADIVLLIPVPHPMNPYDAEKMVHQYFSAKNVNGCEDFELDHDDMETLHGMAFLDGRLLIEGRSGD